MRKIRPPSPPSRAWATNDGERNRTTERERAPKRRVDGSHRRRYFRMELLAQRRRISSSTSPIRHCVVDGHSKGLDTGACRRGEGLADGEYEVPLRRQEEKRYLAGAEGAAMGAADVRPRARRRGTRANQIPMRAGINILHGFRRGDAPDAARCADAKSRIQGSNSNAWETAPTQCPWPRNGACPA